ncbi:hypothetical protein HER18_13280 [Chryseobacterium sp. NEB161]|nr:hypothetical protein HER18_13280 [Chryseobacterium sp. NEB161]
MNNEFNNQAMNTENYSSQDAGIELLHRVIESNKAVEISGKAIFHMYCDIKEDVKKIQALAHEENLKRQELLKSIPNNIIAELSPDVIKHLEKFHQKSDTVKYWFFGILALLLVAFFILTATVYLGKTGTAKASAPRPRFERKSWRRSRMKTRRFMKQSK